LRIGSLAERAARLDAERYQPGQRAGELDADRPVAVRLDGVENRRAE